MDAAKYLGRSQLFLVRLWPEEETDGRAAWCGSVQHPVSGRAHAFRGPSELIRVLLTMMPEGPEPGEDKGRAIEP